MVMPIKDCFFKALSKMAYMVSSFKINSLEIDIFLNIQMFVFEYLEFLFPSSNG